MRGARLLAACLLASAGVLLGAGPAAAESCTVSATAVNFGSYDLQSGTALDSTGTVSVTCTSVGDKRVNYDVLLSTGQAGSYNPRAMTNGISQLNYNLYTRANRNQVWGDGTGGTQVNQANYNLVPIGSTQTDTHTTYGRITAGQIVTTGTYVDTITVTVNF